MFGSIIFIPAKRRAISTIPLRIGFAPSAGAAARLSASRKATICTICPASSPARRDHQTRTTRWRRGCVQQTRAIGARMRQMSIRAIRSKTYEGVALAMAEQWGAAARELAA